MAVYRDFFSYNPQNFSDTLTDRQTDRHLQKYFKLCPGLVIGALECKRSFSIHPNFRMIPISRIRIIDLRSRTLFRSHPLHEISELILSLLKIGTDLITRIVLSFLRVNNDFSSYGKFDRFGHTDSFFIRTGFRFEFRF